MKIRIPSHQRQTAGLVSGGYLAGKPLIGRFRVSVRHILWSNKKSPSTTNEVSVLPVAYM